MEKDLYDILDLVENAPEQMISRAYQLKLAALEGKAGISDSERQAQRRILDDAYRTLSNPNLRSSYDGMLLRRKQASEKKGAVWLRALVILAMLGAGAGYIVTDHRKQVAAQEARDQAAREEAARLQKIADEAERKRLALEQDRAERAAQLQAEQEKLENERIEREKFLATHQFVADTSAADAAKARMRAAQEKGKQDAEAEANRRRALEELERQKRYLRERGR